MKPGNPVNHRITGFDHPPDPEKPGTHNRRSDHESPGFRVSGSLSAPRPRTNGPAQKNRPSSQPQGELIPMSRNPSSSTRTHLTVIDFCTELGVARSTFYEWRAKGTGPRSIKLPNGEIRIRRTDADAWLNDLEESA